MPKEKFKLEDVLYPDEKVAIFIDGANLYGTAKALGLDIDYRKLKQEFSRITRLVRIYYYTAIIDDAEYSPVRPLVDWLDYNGYTLVTKPVREYTDALTGRKKIKGSMDIDLAVDAMSISSTIDHVVIVSGDGDYKRLAEALQKQGRRVSVISTIVTQPPMISDELRRQADTFIELNDLRPYIERDQSRNINTSIEKELSKLPMNFGEIVSS
ncbi:MAG: uncharacterized LabA/DUF88 family protein [Alphaproteobacteria bacterium]|jgi:uncharacterized LabA/DUF88 family protein